MQLRTQPYCYYLLFIIWLLSACSPSPKLSEIPDNGRILAFGDSLTVGVGTTPQHSYPTVLSQLSGRTVINAGVSGETTAEGLARLGTVLSQTPADLIVLIEGGNDILRNQNLTRSKQNLAQMIELAQSYALDVVLIGVPEKKLFSNAAPMYAELAEEYGLVYDGELIAQLIRTQKYKSDSVHFNQDGYRVMAEEIYALLQKHGAF
jgi:lysophospholipase L1-like esterase